MALDHNLKPFSLSRWIGVKPKALEAKLGDPKHCEPAHEVTEHIKREMGEKIEALRDQVSERADAAQDKFEARRIALVKKQAAERCALNAMQARQRLAANKLRQARFARGLSAVWDRLRGEHKRIREQNEREAYAQAKTDLAARDQLIWRHLEERRRIDIWKLRHRSRVQSVQQTLERDVRDLSVVQRQFIEARSRAKRPKRRRNRDRHRTLEPEP